MLKTQKLHVTVFYQRNFRSQYPAVSVLYKTDSNWHPVTLLLLLDFSCKCKFQIYF